MGCIVSGRRSSCCFAHRCLDACPTNSNRASFLSPFLSAIEKAESRPFLCRHTSVSLLAKLPDSRIFLTKSSPFHFKLAWAVLNLALCKKLTSFCRLKRDAIILVDQRDLVSWNSLPNHFSASLHNTVQCSHHHHQCTYLSIVCK